MHVLVRRFKSELLVKVILYLIFSQYSKVLQLEKSICCNMHQRVLAIMKGAK